MSMSTETKKQLLAQFGPACWNGNCKGPPECLLRHPNTESKKFSLRGKSRSSSAIEGVAKENENAPSDRPRSNSTSANKMFPDIHVDRHKADEDIVGLVMTQSLTTRTTNQKSEASKAEEAIVKLAIAKSLENEKEELAKKKANEERLEKDEERTIKLAMKNSLEATCPYCNRIFSDTAEVQHHILVQHQDDEEEIEIITETTDLAAATEDNREESSGEESDNSGDDTVVYMDGEVDLALHEKIENYVQEVIQSSISKANEEATTSLDSASAEVNPVAEETAEVETLRDEVQQLKNSLKVMKATMIERDSTIQSLEDQVKKLEENNHNKDLECKRIKKNLIQHQVNEKAFKEKSETLLSEKQGLERTINHLQDHLEHLQTTMNMIKEDEDVTEDHEGSVNAEDMRASTPVSVAEPSDDDDSDLELESVADQRDANLEEVNGEVNTVLKPDIIKIKNFGGGEMTVANMEKLLGMDNEKNVGLKDEISIRVNQHVATLKVSKRLCHQILQLNNIDINGKKLSVVQVGMATKPCYYFHRKGRCEKGERCTFSHEPSQRINEPCKFYLQGKCTRKLCPFLHDGAASTDTESTHTKRKCRHFMKGKCTRNPCQFEHPICRNYANKVACSYGQRCRFVCYKDQKQEILPTGDIQNMNNISPGNGDAVGAIPNSNVNSLGVTNLLGNGNGGETQTNNSQGAPHLAMGTQEQRGTKSAFAISKHPQPPMGNQQGLTNGQNQGVNNGTNDTMSFLGQKVDGLERVVANLLQFQMMLRSAYCPPQIPQIQTLAR